MTGIAGLIAGRRYVFVTGKGGVGKTTVAAALGVAAARSGRRTIVCEVGDQRRLPRLWGIEGPAHGEEVALGDGLFTVSVDPNTALREWLARQLGSRSLVQVLTRSNLFQYFVAAAPGARELVTATKLWELGQDKRWDKKATAYDLVIADLPASGHGMGLLRTARTFADIARVGPIGSQAGRVAAVVEDPKVSGLLAVALAAELPVSETLELEERAVRELRRDVDAVVVNAVLPNRWTAAELDALDASAAVAPAVRRAARSAAGRAAAQQSQLRRLRKNAQAEVTTLPFLATERVDLEAVRGLADELERRL